MSRRMFGYSQSELKQIRLADKQKELAANLGVPTKDILMACFVDFSFVMELLQDENKYKEIAAKLKLKAFW